MEVRALAWQLQKSAAAKNATVIIISSNRQRINKALEELPESATGYAIDVTDEAQVKSIFEKIGFFRPSYIYCR